MKCKAAMELIDRGATTEALELHLQGCSSCGARRALWALLREASPITPSEEFTNRLQEALRAEAARTGPRGASRRAPATTLDEFADFPPGSLGQFLFGKLRRG
jgi:hypothetical protein